MLTVVHDAAEANDDANRSLLDEIVRDGARQMLAAALQAEVAAYVAQSSTSSTTTVTGWWSQRLSPAQEVLTAAGAVQVSTAGQRSPRRSDTGARQRFSSAILPAWALAVPCRW